MNELTIGLGEKTLETLEKIGVNGKEVIQFAYEASLKLPMANLVSGLITFIILSILFFAVLKARKRLKDNMYENAAWACAVSGTVLGVFLAINSIFFADCVRDIMAPEAFAIDHVIKMLHGPK